MGIRRWLLQFFLSFLLSYPYTCVREDDETASSTDPKEQTQEVEEVCGVSLGL